MNTIGITKSLKKNRQGELPYKVPIEFKKQTIKALIDTGSRVNVVSNKFIDKFDIKNIQQTKYSVVMVDSSGCSVSGQINLVIKLGKRWYTITAIVVPKFSKKLLLGRDFAMAADMDLLTSSRLIRSYDTFYDLDTRKEVHFPIYGLTAEETTLKRLTATEVTFTCARKSGQFIIKLAMEEEHDDGELYAELQMVRVENHQFKAVIMNKSFCSKTICKKYPLLEVKPLALPRIDSGNNLPTEEDIQEILENYDLEEILMSTEAIVPEENFEKLLEPATSHLDGEKRKAIVDILEPFAQIISKHRFDLGQMKNYEMEIDTGDTGPIHQRQYRMSPGETQALKEICESMEKQGLLRKSKSPWSSPVILVKKPDGSLRLVNDYRALNAVTKRNKWPLPRIDDILDKLKQAKYFSTIDLTSGFWQLKLSETASPKTAFATPFGHYEYTCMSMGITNGPPTFQACMQEALGDLLQKNCMVYLDDILVYSKSFEEHLEHIQEVMKRLQKAGLKIKPNKCVFAAEEVKYLGHRVSANGIHCDHMKIAAVKKMPLPSNKKDLLTFLGLAQYYRRFIPNLARMSKPLYEMVKKNANFVYNKDRKQAFANIKQKLIESPVMAHPDFDKEFVVATDACQTGLGAVLKQVDDEGHERVIAYASRILKGAETRYHCTQLELLAIAWALEEFRPYLADKKFTLVTDHKTLLGKRNLTSDKSGRVARWIDYICNYHFDIVYKPGKFHLDADALSRLTSKKVIKAEKVKQKLHKVQKATNVLSLEALKVEMAKTVAKMTNKLHKASETKSVQDPENLGNITTMVTSDLADGQKGASHQRANEVYQNCEKEALQEVLGGASHRYSASNMQKNTFSQSAYHKRADGTKVGVAAKRKQLHKASERKSVQDPRKLGNITTMETSDLADGQKGARHQRANEVDQNCEKEALQEVLGGASHRYSASNMQKNTFSQSAYHKRADGTKVGVAAKRKTDLIQKGTSALYVKCLDLSRTVGLKQNQSSIENPICENNEGPEEVKTYHIDDILHPNDCTNVVLPLIKKNIQSLKNENWAKPIINEIEKNGKLTQTDAMVEFHIVGGRMWRLHRDLGARVLQICIDEAQRDKLLKHFHDNKSHMGMARTLFAIKQWFFWPSMKEDVYKYVKTCKTCQLHKTTLKRGIGEFHTPPVPAYPFDHIHIDVGGPLIGSYGNYKYYIVAIDRLTKYAVCKPVAKANANSTCLFLQSIQQIFGKIRILTTDQGREFVNNVFQKMLTTLRIEHHQTTAYRPAGNGMVERLNRTLKTFMSSRVPKATHYSWPVELSKAVADYNQSIHETTGHTPHRLLFGYPYAEHNYPAVPLKLLFSRGDQLIELNDLRDQVIAKLLRRNEMIAQRYNRNRALQKYQVNDLVLIESNKKANKQQIEKLLPKFEGPFLVKQVLHGNTYLININGKTGKRHADQMKPFFRRNLSGNPQTRIPYNRLTEEIAFFACENDLCKPSEEMSEFPFAHQRELLSFFEDYCACSEQ